MKNPWIIGFSIGGLLAVIVAANSQTLGPPPAPASSGGLLNFSSDGTTLSGSTQTIVANAPIMSLSQAWNNAGVAFTGLLSNITNTNSAATSLLMDLKVGGTSAFRVDVGGIAVLSNNIFMQGGGNNFALGLTGGSARAQLHSGAGAASWSNWQVAANGAFAFSSSDNDAATGAPDTYITRNGAAATLQFGLADAASPAAQTLGVQSVVAGTSNVTGSNFTINGSKSTGTANGGNIIFQVTPPGSATGTNQNAFVQSTILDSLAHIRVGNITAPAVTNCGGGSPSVSGTDEAGLITLGTTSTGCTLTFTKPYLGEPFCAVTWQTSLATMNYVPVLTGINITQTSTSSNKINYICRARNGG